jgi:hypothetical protein
VPDDQLSMLWRQQWPHCPPLAHTLKHVYRDRWVRFHSLPESKRYPEDDAEYDIVLHRYNTVLDELFHAQEVLIVTTDSSNDPEPPPAPPDARHWTSIRTTEDESDPDFINYDHLYVRHAHWQSGLIDDLLRAVADYAVNTVMVASPSFDRIHHPYDGGADVLLPTSDERDALKRRYSDWLSSNPQGL